jgi:predicted glutamine amidotransferase
MCRIFACRSHHPSGAEGELLAADNALRCQSTEHPDGWGLAWYRGSEPEVVRSLAAAHADEEFARVCREVRSPTIVAHVRKASVGEIAMENTHPFRRGRWIFVHNGTVPEWQTARPLIEEQIDPSLRTALQGETDSERCFALFYTLLAKRCDPEAAPFEHAVAALRETVRIVREASEPSPEGKAATTFLLTDGRLLLACRRGRSLHLHAPPPDEAGKVAWVALSSENPGRHKLPPRRFEPVDGEQQRDHSVAWQAVDEDAWVGVDGGLVLHRGWL